MNTAEQGPHLGVVDTRQSFREDAPERMPDVPEERRQENCDGPGRDGFRLGDGLQHDRAGQGVRFDWPSVAFKMTDGLKHPHRGKPDDLRRHEGSSFFKARMNGIRRSTPSIIPGFSITSESST